MYTDPHIVYQLAALHRRELTGIAQSSKNTVDHLQAAITRLLRLETKRKNSSVEHNDRSGSMTTIEFPAFARGSLFDDGR